MLRISQLDPNKFRSQKKFTLYIVIQESNQRKIFFYKKKIIIDNYNSHYLHDLHDSYAQGFQILHLIARLTLS